MFMANRRWTLRMDAVGFVEGGPSCTFTPRVQMFRPVFFVSIRIFSFVISFIFSAAGGRLKKGLFFYLFWGHR